MLLCLILLAAMIFAFGACRSENPPAQADPTPTPEQVAPTQPPAQDEQSPEEIDGLDVPFFLAPMANRVTLNIGASFGTPEGADVPPGTTPSTSTIPDILDLLNIELNFMWEVPSAQGAERFQLAVATGEIPDIMRLGSQDFAEFSQFGMLRDLSEAFERYIHPEIREMFEYFNDIPLEMSTRNGELLAIPHVLDSFQHVSLLWYRHDWMEALDMSIPTTIDELEELALAFVENDMSGQGTTGMALFDQIIH